MAIQKKSLIGSAASRGKEADSTPGRKPEAKGAERVKPSASKKLAVAKQATAKLSTARLMVLRKIT